MRTGDGWTICASGHRHWGRYGAAGLMITDDRRVILQHRAPWTHEGDRWGVLGGARDSGEGPVETALREAHEEAGIDAKLIDPIGWYEDDHGGWSYTTVVARTLGVVEPGAINAESVSVRWHEIVEVTQLPLHSGFQSAWEHLRSVPEKLHLVVATELAGDPLVARVSSSGLPTHRLPDGIAAGGLTRLIPEVTRTALEDLERAAERIDSSQVIIARTRDDLIRIS